MSPTISWMCISSGLVEGPVAFHFKQPMARWFLQFMLLKVIHNSVFVFTGRNFNLKLTNNFNIS